ncbi:DEAD/DEAH box helicase [Archangium primigenium]|uniref:DEAD/DEAH box helicase n=1 Tax=[Archangium] primigenium TaxID=2792470 RepID=UPI00195C7529|nr:DEAD/DEAH box helicase [Archangium primigenium]MBM7113533.1 DEAD/DEAH box helicase [Archangium primigenium]
MKFSLPANHGLPDALLGDAELVPRTKEGAPSLTDVQHEALSQGVARGESLLVVAPTSTGKTLVGVWALSSWIFSRNSRRAVYLVTHRALARQKFEELLKLLCDRHLNKDRTSIVLANGDTVEDGAGNIPSEPLNSSILVATYEKYLAMISGTGISTDMSHCAIVCDEIQILGDENRGRNIEVLLTLLRKARWGQFIGLSAVIDARDARDLKDWLEVILIRLERREKHLHYECRTSTRALTFKTDQPEAGVSERNRSPQEGYNPDTVLMNLVQDKSNLPIVVFCMSKKRVEQSVQNYARVRGVRFSPKQPLLPPLREPTASARTLSSIIPQRFAFHTSDLLEEERIVVEEQLNSRKLDVVFATSTLAAGVNFPFKTAVFDDWKLWDSRSKSKKPLSASEFHNMAGRVGRMGSQHSHGSVIFMATDQFFERQTIATYLTPDQTTPLTPRIDPKVFSQLALQLVSSGVCQTADDIDEFLSGSFSAMRERGANRTGLAHWKESMRQAVLELKSWGFIL